MDLPVAYWHTDGTFVYVGFFQKHQRRMQKLKLTKKEFEEKYVPADIKADPSHPEQRPVAPQYVGMLSMD